MALGSPELITQLTPPELITSSVFESRSESPEPSMLLGKLSASVELLTLVTENG